VFGAIGVGMAMPYLLLSAKPSLVKRMPRTGPASELVKQVMGLLMIAVAVFFMGPPIAGWANTPPDPVSRGYWWLVGAFGIVAGGWLLYRTIKITRKPLNRAVFGTVGALIVAASAGVAVILSSHGPINWVYYTPQRFAEAVKEGNVVVIDFTAEWCLNCKALESAVLHQPRVYNVLNGDGVVAIKVDITGDNPDGKAKLQELKWVGIPLLAIYGPGLSEPVKYDNYTPDQVLEAIERARGSRKTAAAGATTGGD
jgi:thiol:disulfide interchange protein